MYTCVSFVFFSLGQPSRRRRSTSAVFFWICCRETKSFASSLLLFPSRLTSNPSPLMEELKSCGPFVPVHPPSLSLLTKVKKRDERRRSLLRGSRAGDSSSNQQPAQVQRTNGGSISRYNAPYDQGGIDGLTRRFSNRSRVRGIFFLGDTYLKKKQRMLHSFAFSPRDPEVFTVARLASAGSFRSLAASEGVIFEGCLRCYLSDLRTRAAQRGGCKKTHAAERTIDGISRKDEKRQDDGQAGEGKLLLGKGWKLHRGEEEDGDQALQGKFDSTCWSATYTHTHRERERGRGICR